MRRFLDQRLKLRHLRVVSAVATEGSLLGAARLLGVSQPALTKAIAEVEDIAGVRLFERHARGMLPNAYGEALVATARHILSSLRTLEQDFDRLDADQGGTLIVGAMPTAAAGLVPRVLTRLRRTDPDVDVRVQDGRTDELVHALLQGDVDLVVGRLYPPPWDDGLLREPMYEEPMALVAGNGHPLAGKGILDPSALADFEIAAPWASFRIHADTQAYLTAIGVDATPGLSTTSLALLREMLLTSSLITVIPRDMLSGDIARGQLVELDVAGRTKAPPRPAGTIRRVDRPPAPPAKRFLAAMKAELAGAP